MYGKRGTWDEIREIAFGDIDAVYVEIDSPLTTAARSICVTNATDQTIYITDDGSHNKLKLLPNSYKFWDLTTNKAKSDDPIFFSVGTQISCKYDGAIAPKSGWVSVEALIVEIGS